MNKIKHIFRKIFHRTDYTGLSVFGRGQHFDWKVLLVFTFLLTIVVVSFSVHVFLGVRNGKIFEDDFKKPVRNLTINREVLDKVLKEYADRQEMIKGLQTQRPVFVDPSL